MAQKTIGIIGGGNMGTALIGGFLRNHIPPTSIWLGDHGAEKCAAFAKKWGIHTTTDNAAVVTHADIVLLAVKPQSLRSLLESLQSVYDPQKTLLISIAAGITTQQIQQWLNRPSIAMIRAMPNTPALLGKGITGLFATPSVTPSEKESAQAILQTVGTTVWLPEEGQMDAVTALSGSGPAYFFYIMEALIQGAQRLGLSEEIARELTLQTAMGSVYMALQNETSLAQLRKNVTSPGGTTEQGINALKDGKLDDLLFTALQAAASRAKSLSELLR